jgi:hypothetical protein
MEVKIVNVHNEIIQKPLFCGDSYPEFEPAGWSNLTFEVYAPERFDNFFTISFDISWNSKKSRTKQVQKTLRKILNCPNLNWKP